MGAVDVSWPAERVALLLVDNGPRNFITWSLNDKLEAVPQEIADDAAVVVLASSVEGFFFAHGHLGDNVETFTGGSTEGDPTSGLRVWKLLDAGPLSASPPSMVKRGAAARSMPGTAISEWLRAVQRSRRSRCDSA